MNSAAHDLAERPPDRRCSRGIGGGILSCDQRQAGEQRRSRLRQKSRRTDRAATVLGEDHELRADHAGEDAAGQHLGDRLRLVGIARRVGGGEAIGLMRGGIEAAAERAERSSAETSPEHRNAGDQPGQRAEAAPICSAERRPKLRASSRSAPCRPYAEHHDRDRQRGETFVRRSIRPTMPAVATITVLLPPANACATASTTRVALGETVVDQSGRVRRSPTSSRVPGRRPVLSGRYAVRHCPRRRSRDFAPKS